MADCGDGGCAVFEKMTDILNERSKENGLTVKILNGAYSCINGQTKLKNGLNKEQNGSVHNQFSPQRRLGSESFEKVPLFTAIMTAFGFYLLMAVGFISKWLFAPKVARETNREGYASMYNSFDLLYMRYIYRRLADCYHQPIASVPGDEVVLQDRVTKDYGWTFEYPGTYTKCLNLASYNYLGFAEASGPCAEAARNAVEEYGTALGAAVHELGWTPLLADLEQTTANFIGVEAAIVFGMGFATNSLNIPCLLEPGCLVLSDERNHASLIMGLKLSGATIRKFKHNNMVALEKELIRGIREYDCDGNTKWKKIVIVVEGVYSVEGSVVKLPELIALKKRFKAYLYLDEAHSVGAMGPRGRGVVDYFGCDPYDVDVLMGTFTKSFGAAGGYIAGRKVLIDHVRAWSHATHYASAMSPGVAAQILTSMRIIMNEREGRLRVRRLARNTRYFRNRLRHMQLIIYGNDDSPVVPVLVYVYSKLGALVRGLKEQRIATVGVGFPATPLFETRIRICLSAAHTREQLDHALAVLEKMSKDIGIRYSRRPPPAEQPAWLPVDEEDSDHNDHNDYKTFDNH